MHCCEEVARMSAGVSSVYIYLQSLVRHRIAKPRAFRFGESNNGKRQQFSANSTIRLAPIAGLISPRLAHQFGWFLYGRYVSALGRATRRRPPTSGDVQFGRWLEIGWNIYLHCEYTTTPREFSGKVSGFRGVEHTTTQLFALSTTASTSSVWSYIGAASGPTAAAAECARLVTWCIYPVHALRTIFACGAGHRQCQSNGDRWRLFDVILLHAARTSHSTGHNVCKMCFEERYSAFNSLVYHPTRCPPGLTLRALDAEQHAPIVHDAYPHRQFVSLFFLKQIIELNPNVGAFDENDQLVAWCLRWTTTLRDCLIYYYDEYNYFGYMLLHCTDGRLALMVACRCWMHISVAA